MLPLHATHICTEEETRSCQRLRFGTRLQAARDDAGVTRQVFAWILSSRLSIRCFITGCPVRVRLRIVAALLFRAAAAAAFPFSLSCLSCSRCTPPPTSCYHAAG